MTLLLDTSILIDLERGDKKTQERLHELSKIHPHPAMLSFMTYVEFLVGIEGLPLTKKASLKEFLMEFPVLHTTNQTAIILSTIKHKCNKQGLQKSLTDLFIASQAIENKLTLATKDRDFKGIPSLAAEFF